VVDDRIVRVARHVQDGHIRAKRYETLRQNGAVHLRHHHIREEEMDRPGMALDDPQRVCNLSSAQNDIPPVLEDPLNERTNLILVFDDQNGLASARRQGADRLHHLLRDTLDAREVEPERASLSRFTFYPDVTAALPDDAVDRRQAEPVPLPSSFVVKKGSKMRAWVSASIPVPVSLTTSIT